MQYPLWPACRTAGVEDVQWVFRIHRLGWAISIHIFHFPVPPGVPAFLDMNLIVRPTENDDPFNLFIVLQSVVDILLQWHDGPVTVSAIRGNHHPGPAILDTILDGFSTEPAEN